VAYRRIKDRRLNVRRIIDNARRYRFLINVPHSSGFLVIYANSIPDHRFLSSCGRTSLRFDVVVLRARHVSLVFAVTSADGSHLSVRRRRGTDSLDVAGSQRTRIFGDPETIDAASSEVTFSLLHVGVVSCSLMEEDVPVKGTKRTIDGLKIKVKNVERTIELCNLSMFKKNRRTLEEKRAGDGRPVASNLRTTFPTLFTIKRY